MEGVFGQAGPATEPAATTVDEADIYLGYAPPPKESEATAAPQTQNTVQEGPQESEEGDSSSEPASDAPASSGDETEGAGEKTDDTATWEQERQKYQQAIQQYEQTLGQLLQMFQTNPYAQMPQGQIPGMPPVPGQMGAPAPTPLIGQNPVPGQAPSSFVDPAIGYPVPQGPVPTMPPQVPSQTAAAPAAPQVSDEELQEQFWQDPVKAARALVEREWDNLLQQRLMPLIQQREAYFGQVFGQQIMAPLVQQVAMVQDEIAWRDKVSQEYQSLRSKHEDFDEVAPVIRQMLSEDPQRFARLRQGQETLESLYTVAKQRASKGRTLTAVPGGKGAARMPRAGAARVPGQGTDNDALVEAALGPASESGGIWG